MTVSVTIGGSNVDRVIDVTYGQKDEEAIGTAQVTAANTAGNRTFNYGEEVVVSRDGSEEFVGVLEKKPSTQSGLTVEFEALDKRVALQYEEVHRPFYNQDTGAIIREAVSERTEPRNPVTLFNGSDLNDLSADADIFELANIPSQRLYERGSDLLFLYWREESSGTFTLTYDAVPTNAAPDRRLLWVETRYLFNNAGGYFQGDLELRDHGGNNYVWDLKTPEGANFQTVRYRTEDATTDDAELTSDGTLQFRIEIRGNIPEPRAAVIDYARTRPFDLQNRGSPVDAPATTVQDSDREITRRFDSTILELIEQLSVEDGAVSFIDENDDLHYEPAGDQNAPVSIDYASTRVVDASFDRDATDIINKVTVQGDGDLQAQVESPASIQFYGVSPREKPLVDKSIQTREDLLAFGKGFLSENAWDDSAFEFTVADRAYRDARVGQAIDVTWPPEDVDGSFIISSKDADGAGRVTLSFTGSEG